MLSVLLYWYNKQTVGIQCISVVILEKFSNFVNNACRGSTKSTSLQEPITQENTSLNRWWFSTDNFITSTSHIDWRSALKWRNGHKFYHLGEIEAKYQPASLEIRWHQRLAKTTGVISNEIDTFRCVSGFARIWLYVLNTDANHSCNLYSYRKKKLRTQSELHSNNFWRVKLHKLCDLQVLSTELRGQRAIGICHSSRKQCIGLKLFPSSRPYEWQRHLRPS